MHEHVVEVWLLAEKTTSLGARMDRTKETLSTQPTLTISWPRNLGRRRTETHEVLGVVAVDATHTAGRVEVELLKLGIAGVGGVDGSSSFSNQAGRARTRRRVRGHDGSSNALWSVIVV